MIAEPKFGMKTKIKTYLFKAALCLPLIGLQSGLFSAIAHADTNETFNVKDYLLIEDSQTFLEGGAIQFLNKIINILSQFVGVLAILILVVSGLIMITSGSNENALAKGKDGFKYAIIGTIISFTAYLITTFVQAVFYA